MWFKRLMNRLFGWKYVGLVTQDRIDICRIHKKHNDLRVKYYTEGTYEWDTLKPNGKITNSEVIGWIPAIGFEKIKVMKDQQGNVLLFNK